MRVSFFLSLSFVAMASLCARGQELKPIPMQPRIADAPGAVITPAAPSTVESPNGVPRQPLPATRPAAVNPSPPAQVPSAPASGRAPQSVSPPAAQGVVPAGGVSAGGGDAPTESRRAAEALLDECLAFDASLQASPLTLVNALANVYDTRRQLAVVDVYWNTSAALGNYFVRRDVLARLEAISPRPADAAIVRSARSAARASLREAELLLQDARYDLAERVGLVPGGMLPLPSDKPHVGTYRTNADWILPTASVLSRARLIDRTLPIRLQAIENRAAAVAEAEQALRVATEAYHADRIAIDSLLAFLRQYSGQYRAFLASVDQYNRNIVEYVVAVMQGPLPADRMVTMLIKPSRQTVPFRRDPSVEPAGAVETRPDSAWKAQDRPRTPGAPSVADPWANRAESGTPTAPRSPNTPTLAPPPAQSGSGQPPSAVPARPSRPTLAPTRPDAGRSAPTDDRTASERPAVETPAVNESAPSQPRDSSAPAESAPAESLAPTPAESPDVESPQPTPAAPERVQPRSDDPPPSAPSNTPAETPSEPPAETEPGPRTHTAFRQIQEESDYAGLAQLEPAGRAAQLAEILHWDRNLPEEMGHPITLAECLRRNLNPNRLDLVRAYWTARQFAAEYQLLHRTVDFLENVAAESADRSWDVLDRHRMDTTRFATEAALHETKAALLAAEYDLTLADGHAFDVEWLYPSTAPAVAPPLAAEETSSPSGATALQPYPGPSPMTLWSTSNRASRRRTDLVVARYAEVLGRAEAVVEADMAKAQRMAEHRAGSGSLEAALRAQHRQMEETFAFLAAVTAYNVERAEVVLERFPPAGSTEQLVRELGCK